MGCLANLVNLKNDMEGKGWVITSFDFNYKKEYVVLAKLYVEGELIPPDAIMKLHFFQENDFSHNKEFDASDNILLSGAKDLREFFGIEYTENLGNILYQFSERLGCSIPKTVPDTYNEPQKMVMVLSLSKSDSEDPTKIYCTNVRRNPVGKNGKQGQRSLYNDNKTRLLRKDLYHHFCSDTGISFCYSKDKNDEKTDAEIIKLFNDNCKRPN